MFTTALNDLMYHLRPARPGQLIDRAAFGEADGQSVSDWQRAAEKALNRPFRTAFRETARSPPRARNAGGSFSRCFCPAAPRGSTAICPEWPIWSGKSAAKPAGARR